MTTAVPLVFLLSAFLSCVLGVYVRSCSNSASGNLVRVNWVNVNPDPIQIPGDITVSASGSLMQPLQGNLDADVTISRKFGPMYIDLPCVNSPMGRVGSCSYTNLCSGLMRNGTRCPSFLRDNNIPCTCPVAAQTYTIPQTIIPLDLSHLNIPSVAIAGEYRASIRVTDKSTMNEVICFDVDVEIREPSRANPFGSLGRFLVNLFG